MTSENRNGKVFKVCHHDRYIDARDGRRHDPNTYALDHVVLSETRAFMMLIEDLERK